MKDEKIDYKKLKVSFMLKNKVKNNKQSIYCRVYFDREDFATFQLGYSVSPDKWRNNKMKGNTDESQEVNKYLDKIRISLFKVYQELIDKRMFPISAKKVIHYHQNPYDLEDKEFRDLPWFLALFKDHVAKVKESIGKGYAYNTYKSLNTTCNHVSNFIPTKYGKQDIPLNKVDYEFMEDFQHYMRTTSNLGYNTVIKQLKNTKKVINIAKKRGYYKQDPVEGFKIKKYKATISYLTNEELQKIEQVRLMKPSIQRVRDMFVFSCYTGVPYIDLKFLTKDNIIEVEGRQMLVYYRGKTETPSKVPLIGVSKRILDKFQRFYGNRGSGLLFPVPSNYRMNTYLKEAAAKAGIEKNITFHMARHTFATVIALSNGIPIEYIQSMLGHTELSTTQGYAKIIDSKLSRIMDGLEKETPEQDEPGESPQ